MVDGRRSKLIERVPSLKNDDRVGDHTGLWFDKYNTYQLEKSKNESPPKDEHGRSKPTPQKQLVDQVHCIGVPEAYERFFKRWEKQIKTMRVAMDGCEYMVQSRYATAQGRIAIGLGDASVIETAVTLHHTYGVPYIPGSALKGLAAAYAHRFLKDDGWRKPLYKDGKLIKKAGDYRTALFGTTANAGYITFFDALYLPGSGHDGKPLWPDVITVHHKDYYTGSNPKPPTDWDSPTPIPFLTATGTYLVALGGPFAWVELTFDLLGKALADMGVGAKTSSGYGRMLLTKERPSGAHATVQQESTAAQATTATEQRQQPAPHAPTIGIIITGQRARMIERFDFKDGRIKGVRITPNKGQVAAPRQRELIIFAEDQQTSGGFRGEVVDIDDSDHRELRVLVKAVRKPKEGA